MIRLRRTHITGFVDELHATSIRGWAADRKAVDESLDVTVVADGRPVVTARAGEFRPDLAAAGYGKGNHGFTIALPEIPPSVAPLEVFASRPDRQHVKAPLEFTSAASIQLMRLFHAKLQSVDPPRSIRETCQRVREGRLDGRHGAPTDVESLYLSDDLFMQTMLAHAEEA